MTHFTINEDFDRDLFTAIEKRDEAFMRSVDPGYMVDGTSELLNLDRGCGLPLQTTDLSGGLIDYVPCYRSEAAQAPHRASSLDLRQLSRASSAFPRSCAVDFCDPVAGAQRLYHQAFAFGGSLPPGARFLRSGRPAGRRRRSNRANTTSPGITPTAPILISQLKSIS